MCLLISGHDTSVHMTHTSTHDILRQTHHINLIVRRQGGIQHMEKQAPLFLKQGGIQHIDEIRIRVFADITSGTLKHEIES